MVNILFDCPNLNDFKGELARYFSDNSRVTVVALSFYDDFVYDAESFARVYTYGEGYHEVVDVLGEFGVKPENIRYINYFLDSTEDAIEKVEWADVLYFTGGLPDRMMERIEEMGIADAIKRHRGVAVGYSAGAVIQLSEYHLSPDSDYSEFGYYHGIGYLNGFYLEVHYEGRKTQDEAIERVLRERGCPVYVSHTRRGGIVVDNGKVKLLGTVDTHP